MRPGQVRPTLRLVFLLARSGWSEVATRSVAGTGIAVAVVGALRGRNAALCGLAGATVAGLVAAPLAIARAARAIKNPPKRQEAARPVGSEPTPDVRLERFRNPIAAARLGDGVAVPEGLRTMEIESSDGTVDALVRSGRRYRWVRAVEVGALAGEPNTARQGGPSAAINDRLPEEGSVWLVPSARYHVLELGPLSESLSRAGAKWAFVCQGDPGAGLATEIGRWSREYFVIDGADAVRDGEPRALVLMNDWGAYAGLVAAAKAHSVPTFAKVEGAQDFDNRDTLRRTLPYRTADYVMCQGAYDKRHVGDRGVVVGSCRLEGLLALADAGLKETPIRGRTVANFNFSYGTREYAAGRWLNRVDQACRGAGMSLAVSVHPAVQTPAGFDRCLFPLAFELERADFFVTRSSTALFDAVALGTNVAYFNPHREKCWIDLAFADVVPRIARTRDLSVWLRQDGAELAAAQAPRRRAWLAETFLSIDSTPSEDRMAALVLGAS